MGKKLYVGNLGPGTGPTALKRLFDAHGTVEWVTLVTDPRTGRSKGYGFVGMSTAAEAQAAIAALNGMKLAGRVIQVGEGKPRKKR